MGEDDVGVWRSQWGELTIDSAVPRVGTPLTCQRYVWRPSRELAADLPADYRLELVALRGTDGTRRFAPDGPIQAFVVTASLGGLAILDRIRELTPEERSTYQLMRLIFQTGPSFREFLHRSFSRSSDLYTPGQSGDERHILPETLGVDAKGRGRPWTPADILAHGRAASGKPDVAPAEVIRLGLTAAAQRNPLDPAGMSETEARAMVRMAMFDFDPVDTPLTEEKRAVIRERLLQSVECHLNLDGDAFRGWLFENLDNIVHGIAKRKTGGRKVDRVDVRQALLELAFDAYTYVGDCVCLQMQAFVKSLPTPLTVTERGVFESMYYKQNYLGGMPLVLLFDRFGLLRDAILALWNEPTEEHRTGVVMRMLSDYGVMVRTRRAADRDVKRRQSARTATGRPSVATMANPNDLAADPMNNRFQEIAAAMREQRGGVRMSDQDPLVGRRGRRTSGGPGHNRGPM